MLEERAKGKPASPSSPCRRDGPDVPRPPIRRPFARRPLRRAAGVVHGCLGHRVPGRGGRGSAPAAPSGLRGATTSPAVGGRRGALDSARHLLAGLFRERVLDPSPDRRAHHGGRSRELAIDPLRLLCVRAGSQGGVRAARLHRLRLQTERGALPLLGRRVLRGDDRRLHASTWGADWLAGSLAQRIRLPGARSLTLGVVAIKRPDHVYYGMGPSTLESAQSRYGEEFLDGTMTFDVPLWRSSRVQTAIGVRTASFYDGHYGADPTLTQQVRAGVFALPPGFADGYTAETNRILVALDSRRKYPAPGSGVRLEGRALLGNVLSQSPASGWVRTDGTAAGYLDVDGHRRVISLSAEASFSDPAGAGPRALHRARVARRATSNPMPGFLPRAALVDRSAAPSPPCATAGPSGRGSTGPMQAAPSATSSAITSRTSIPGCSASRQPSVSRANHHRTTPSTS